MNQRVALIAAADTAEEFGAALRAAREHAGIDLTDITSRCKIAVGHLEALERGDLSKWPQGIYRRAYLRDYAGVVGLPLELVLDTFTRLFEPPAVEGVDAAHPDLVKTTEPAPRLELLPAARTWRAWTAERALGACADVTLVVFAAVIVAAILILKLL
jgi:transcriptional regulator with XRE-family HTH domain